MNTTYRVGTLVTIRGPFVDGISRIGLPFEIGIVTHIFLSEDDYITPIYQIYFIEAKRYSVMPSQMLWELQLSYT